MNKIYNSKIGFKKVLFLFLTLLSFDFSLAQIKNEKNIPYTFTAKDSKQNIKWNRNSNVAVLVVISENSTEPVPTNFDSYAPQSEFRKGSNIDNSYVVYKGIGNEVELSGLKLGVDHYVWVYETNAAGILKNITNDVLGPDSYKTVPNSPMAATPVVCPAVGGIVCTLNGSTSSGYIAGPAPCNAASFATTNPWDGASCTGFISFTFSSPVKTTIIKMIAVNTAPENTTISQTGGTGGTLSTSGPVCMSAAGLVLGPYTGSGSYGDVAVTVSSTGTYLTLTCTNTGCNSGWVAACPSFISVLPIELISFTGECNVENVVDLKWKTISETNNDFFTIERSNNTYDWEIIGRVKGAGNSTQVNDYKFTDKQRFTETVYYRIKQTDFNSESKYSEIIAVSNCKLIAASVDEVSIYPNPATDVFTVNSNSSATTLEIYNALGVMVAKKNLEVGENKLNSSDLKSGTYYVKISDATSASKMTKLIINP